MARGTPVSTAEIQLTDADVQIGAVELKDATSSTRAVVKSDGTNNALVTVMNTLPSLVAGTATIGDVTVSSMSSLVTGTATIGSVKITDDYHTLTIAQDGTTTPSCGLLALGTDGLNAQAILVDSSGYLLPGSGASNLGKAEDAGHTSGDLGVMMLSVRQNTAAALSGTDADYQPLITDTNGRLHVLDQNSAAILTSVQLIDDTVYVDDADWTTDSSKHLLVGGLYGTNTITDGDTGPIAINASGEVKVVQATAGNLNCTEASASSILTSVQLIDDAVYIDDADWTTDSSKHLLVGGLYGTNTITDGDVGPIAINASGEVKVVQATAANLNCTEASASTISAAVATPTTLTGGSETVDAVGTAQVLGTTLATKSIYIRAKSTNTSFICVGDSNVDEATNQQIILYANDSVTIDIANRVTVYIDADVINEGVDYLCMS